MVLKRNIAFVAVLAALAVALLAALVWTHSRVSGRNRINNDIRTTLDKRTKLQANHPTAKHLAAVTDERKKAEAEYAELTKTLLTWWDRDVYDETKSPRQSVLFLGSLQQLRSQIRAFAAHRDQNVLLAAQVDNLGFPELESGAPPSEVTIDMLKRESIARDIMMLLIHNKVQSIDAVTWLGAEQGGKLYNKHLVSVTFRCKYPALAKFQTELVSQDKTVVGTYGQFPRNYLVIKELSYETEDQKVAALTAAGKETTRTVTAYGGRTWAPPEGVPPENLNIHRTTQPQHRTGTVPGATTQPGTRVAPQARPTVGREPNYNILTVTMTIAMVDFTEEITGKIPTPAAEEGTGPGPSSTKATASNAPR